jgi:hypothetical protein
VEKPHNDADFLEKRVVEEGSCNESRKEETMTWGKWRLIFGGDFEG